MAARTILITADDFGWTDGQNQAVALGAEKGTLHRASLLANGPAFSAALRIAAKNPALGVGVHLTLCEGRPLLLPSQLGPLCRADGQFHDGLGPLVKLYFSGRLDVKKVAAEWQAQIERAITGLGGLRSVAAPPLSHLDGHKHVHLLLPLFDLALSLAERYGIPYLRIPVEGPGRVSLARAPAWAVLSGLAVRARQRFQDSGTRLITSDHFVGFAWSGAMTPERLTQAILSARPGLTEIMLHPAADTPGMQALGREYAWARRYRFSAELAALLSPTVAFALKKVAPQKQRAQVAIS